MFQSSLRTYAVLAAGLLLSCLSSIGCTSFKSTTVQSFPAVPHELDKQPQPDYVIEPPDILQIDVLRMVPKGGYKIEASDILALRVSNTLPDAPIDGEYEVDIDGTINLGPEYGGKLAVVDLNAEEARAAISKRLATFIKGHSVRVEHRPSKAVQQVRGQHLVRPDGTVGLGVYGGVRIVGMTIEQARSAIEKHLAKQFVRPEVSVDVIAYNSKLFYVIMDGGGNGEQVIRLPVTGNETVLDAIAQVNGILPVKNGFCRPLWRF